MDLFNGNIHTFNTIQKIFRGHQGLLYVQGNISHTITLFPQAPLHKPGKSMLLAVNSDSSIYKNLDLSEYQWSKLNISVPGEAIGSRQSLITVAFLNDLLHTNFNAIPHVPNCFLTQFSSFSFDYSNPQAVFVHRIKT